MSTLPWLEHRDWIDTSPFVDFSVIQAAILTQTVHVPERARR